MVLNTDYYTFQFGMMAYVFATGQFPAKVLETVDVNSQKEGLSVGRLTQFSKEEQNIIKAGNVYVCMSGYGVVITYFNVIVHLLILFL